MPRGRPTQTAFLLVLLALSSGCFQVKDELVIEPDGSGSVQLHVRAVGGNGWRRIGSYFGASQPILVYPPTSAAEAKQFFPETEFIVTTKLEQDKGAAITRVTATFSDVNALLASPYGQAHALGLKVEGGLLRVEAVSGLELVARGIELVDPTGMFVTRMPEATLAVERTAMRMEFHVTLPNAVTQTNGKQTNQTVAWIVERSQFENAADFANQTGERLQASCSADGLTWKPKAADRLPPGRFETLVAGPGPASGPTPETEQVLAAAKFAAHKLMMTRSVDFLGEAWNQDGAQLTGAVSVPAELAPTQWGEVRLEEVLDSRGNNLVPARQGRRSSRSFSSSSGLAMAEPSAERSQPVTIEFRPPEWGIDRIARIKASLPMEYYGGLELIKLTNAIAAELITVSDNALNEIAALDHPLRDGRLTELGLEASLQAGLVQGGVTLLILEWSGALGRLYQGQVFDGEGRPWPTVLQKPSDSDETTVQLIVPGRPPLPLSLAFLVSGTNRTIEFPILLEDLAIHGGTE